MCHQAVINFAKKCLTWEICYRKNIIEAGSLNVNGTTRDVVMAFLPNSYIGFDMRPGVGVDVVCNVVECAERFGYGTADVLITTEMMEHVENWQAAIIAMKRLCKVGGHILLTTRSPGFPLHEYPGDFWRFTKDDMSIIFSDFEIIALEDDPQAKGVCLFARKTSETDLTKQNFPENIFAMTSPK